MRTTVLAKQLTSSKILCQKQHLNSLFYFNVPMSFSPTYGVKSLRPVGDIRTCNPISSNSTLSNSKISNKIHRIPQNIESQNHRIAQNIEYTKTSNSKSPNSPTILFIRIMNQFVVLKLKIIILKCTNFNYNEIKILM